MMRWRLALLQHPLAILRRQAARLAARRTMWTRGTLPHALPGLHLLTRLVGCEMIKCKHKHARMHMLQVHAHMYM